MAFKNKNFSVVAFCNGWTWWHYVSHDDSLRDIIDNNEYFLPVRALMNTGDMIVINGKDTTGVRYIEMADEGIWLRKLK